MMTRERSFKKKTTLFEYLDPVIPDVQEVLASASIHNADWRIRSMSIEKLHEPSLLALVAKQSDDYEIFKAAIEQLEDEALLEEVAEYPCEDRYACVLALRKINNPDVLFAIAQEHPFIEVRIQATRLIADQNDLLIIAENNSDAEVREEAVRRLEDQEALAQIACVDMNRSVRRTAIAALYEPELLATIASGIGPILIRKAALQRIQEICGGEELDQEIAEQLLPCLERSELAAQAVSLMEQSGFNWYAHCPAETPSSLCEALGESEKYQEAAALKRALAQLYKKRIDFRAHLLVYLPRSFLEQVQNQSPARWETISNHPEMQMLRCL